MGCVIAHQNKVTAGDPDAKVDAFAQPREVATGVPDISEQNGVQVMMKPLKRKAVSLANEVISIGEDMEKLEPIRDCW